jgi:hypothetical protein
MKRMVVSYNGEHMKIVNPDGTVVIADDHGNAMAFRGNVAVKLSTDPRTCKHERTYLVYRDADGISYYCQDCGCTIDEDGEIVFGGEPEF